MAKKSHADVNYRTGVPGKQCQDCRYMNGVHCDLVVDPIYKTGTCDLWEAMKGPRMADSSVEYDVQAASDSYAEELYAYDAYSERIANVADDALREVMAHNRGEETEHADLLAKWLTDAGAPLPTEPKGPRMAVELEARKKDPDKPYGDVKYADPGYQSDGKARYPIDTEDHAKAAWSYINQDKNASAYTADQLSKIKGRIKAALKKFGVEVSDDQKGHGMDLEARKARADQLRGREVRQVPLAGFEMRDAGDGTWTVEGCASVTERAYSMGWYDETIARGAFSDTLSRNPDVQLLLNHTGLPLARTVGGSLRLWEGDDGLMFRASVAQSDPDAQRLQAKASRGLMDQCSFAFSGAKSDWDDDMTQRRITTLDIHRGDVSIVNQGANPFTSFAMRSLYEQLVAPNDEQLEELRASLSPEQIEMAFTTLRKLVPAEPEEKPAPVTAPDLDTYLARAYAFAARARG